MTERLHFLSFSSVQFSRSVVRLFLSSGLRKYALPLGFLSEDEDVSLKQGGDGDGF